MSVEGAVDIGPSTDFREGKGLQVDVQGRALCVFRYEETLYALDNHCYHMGGPLSVGDIEELVVEHDNTNENTHHPCVVCPWHSYKISLKTGERLYKHQDIFGTVPPQTKSLGKKQRTHVVYENSDTGRVFVALNKDNNTPFPSDRYASEEMYELMKRAAAGNRRRKQK